MSLDVRLRLRLEQNVEKEGKEAKRALKALSDEAKKLGRTRGADNLDNDLKKVSRTSRKTKTDVDQVKAAADRLNRVKTDRAEKEFRQLGTQADRTRRKIAGVNTVASSGKANALVGPMGRLSTSAMGLAAGLTAAFTVPEIMRGMSEMKTAADELEASLTQLLLIEGDFSPEKRDAAKKRNAELGVRYGMTQDEILSASNALAQGGIVGNKQNALLEPILKASKASGSAPDTIAKAVRAVVQNLNVAEGDVPKVLDRMLAGGKAGSFEIEDMASAFPELAAVYANSGRSGLAAVDELIAMGQIVRENTGTSSEAATSLREILNKVYSPEVLKNMKDAGIKVKDLAKQADKSDQPLLPLLIEAIEKKGMTDQFGLGELVTDTNARLALNALTQKKGKWSELLNQIRGDSDGAVDKDFGIISNTDKFKKDRRDAALGASGRSFGEVIGPVFDGIMDFFTRRVNSDYDRIKRYEGKGGADADRVRGKISDAKSRLAELEANPSAVPGAQFQMGDLKLEIKRLESTLNSILKYGKGGPEAAGKIDVPDVNSSHPLKQFHSQLDKELIESKLKVADAVVEMQRMLNFSASPTISPVINPPSGGGVKKMNYSGGGAGNTTINVNGSGSPQQTAAAVQRKMNRDVRATRGGALHDTGSYA